VRAIKYKSLQNESMVHNYEISHVRRLLTFLRQQNLRYVMPMDIHCSHMAVSPLYQRK
jgi:hypothetical protein